MHTVKDIAVLEPTWPVLASDTPIIYEDEEAGEMGEANRHVNTNEIVHICLKSFLRERHPSKRVYCNMNCYYAPGPKHARTGSLPYVSPDDMIVEPFAPLSEDIVSYTIGQTGPPPLVVFETLSKSTAEENDLDAKVKIYADLKIPEYILIDVTGELLPQKLLLKRLQPDGTWKDERDPDGGVTSNLGFRLLIDENDELVVVDAKTGKRYVRPQDAQELIEAEARARKLAEKKIRETEKKVRETEKKVQETEKKVQETEKKVQETEKKASAETEARRLAEEKVLALQAELDRLRANKTTKTRRRFSVGNNDDKRQSRRFCDNPRRNSVK